MTIREATLSDVPALVAMGCRFRAKTAYASFVNENQAQMAVTASGLITGTDGVIFVAEGRSGELVGMIGLRAFRHPMSGELTVGELFWWSDDESSDGMRLYRRGLQWAKASGATKFQMTQPEAVPRLAGIFEHLGFQRVESAWQMNLAPSPRIHVYDDVMPDPDTYRAAALACEFKDEQVSPEVVFHGMAGIGHSPLSTLLQQEFGLATTYEAFRLSPEGQEEPSFVHQDRDMGEWTGILYLNPDPPETDGTDFFRHRPTGAIESTSQTDEEKLAEWVEWRDLSLWEPWHHVAAKFNRLLLFPSPYFHGRAIFQNWGAGLDGRLIHLCFGTGVLPCV